jgi:hypothetical protein
VAIHHEGREYFAELLVVAVDKDAEALAVKPMRIIDLTEVEVVAADWATATIADERPPRGWCVRLGKRIARTGFPTEAAARAFLDAKQTLARAGRAS